jgi:hypothetical protein
MDYKSQVAALRARIDALRKIIDKGELDNYVAPKTIIEDLPIQTKHPSLDAEKLKKASELDALRSKLTKKK